MTKINEAKWNAAIDFLMQGEEFARIQQEGRYAEVANMSGGRYLLGDHEGVTGLTDSVIAAVHYVVYGEYNG